MKTSILLLASALSGALAFGSLGQNLVVNGSFEQPAYPAGNLGPFERTNQLPGWQVANSPGAIDVELGLFGGAIASAGNQSVDLEGAENLPGYFIAQSISLIPGQRYQFGFDYAKNPAQSLSRMTVQLSGASTSSLDFVHDLPNGRTDMRWQQASWEFVAAGDTLDLRFVGNSPASGYGMFLDNVTVVAVPEPSALALAGLGLAALFRSARNARRE